MFINDTVVIKAVLRFVCQYLTNSDFDGEVYGGLCHNTDLFQTTEATRSAVINKIG
jgi:hypothetical protein